MRNHVTQIATAIAIAALAGACGGATGSGQEGSAGQAARGAGQNVKVEGCLAPASSKPGEYVLRDLFMPEPAEQPTNQETMQRPPIENGSWARLAGGGNTLDLKDYLGQRVEVTGTISDTGRNTLATSGHIGSNEDKFERSSRDSGSNPVRNITPTTAAPAGADANGDAPQIAVEQIKKLADSCEGGR